MTRKDLDCARLGNENEPNPQVSWQAVYDLIADRDELLALREKNLADSERDLLEVGRLRAKLATAKSEVSALTAELLASRRTAAMQAQSLRALEAELSEVNAAVDASTEAGAEYATRELRDKLTEMAVAISKVVDERDEARAQVGALRDVLRAEIAMPHICSDCGWNVGGVPKGLHNFGCRVANAVDDPAEAAMAFVARVRSEAQAEQAEEDRAAVVRRFSGSPEYVLGELADRAARIERLSKALDALRCASTDPGNISEHDGWHITNPRWEWPEGLQEQVRAALADAKEGT